MNKMQLGMLDKKWLETKEIVVYGFGVIAKKCIDMLLEDFDIPYIIDNAEDKKGTFYKNIPIISQAEMMAKKEKKCIVVMGTIGVYNSISKSLSDAGYIENKDFCLVDLFVAEWYWNNRNQIHLVEVHTTITTRCTLKCKNCNMFMPYYEEHMDMTFEQFKDEMNALFAVADRVFSIGILGGEPLINKDLAKMINFLDENYGDRIGEISLITNATIMPNEELLGALNKSIVRVHISDYTEIVSYEKIRKEVENVLSERGISYRVNSSLIWCDFGFPENKFDYSNVREHMMKCFPVFRGLNDKKLFFCHVAWSAEKCGKYRLSEKDYFELSKVVDSMDEKEAFINYSLGGNEDWSLSLCRFCGGCGIDNKKYVKAGIQV